MSILLTLVVIAQVLSALGVIILVLLQHGKGADMGAAFGSGASGSLFGATGSANFLSRTTGVLAAVFFASTLGLAFLQTKSAPSTSKSVMEQSIPGPAVPAQGEAAAPSVSADPDAAQKNGQATQIPK
jgi:preprotein translocase subunit SecG